MSDTTTTQVRFNYEGSLGIIILWSILFFPVALILLLTWFSFDFEQKRLTLRYHGSRGWLCFWWVVLFPVAIFLLLTNGFEVKSKPQYISGTA